MPGNQSTNRDLPTAEEWQRLVALLPPNLLSSQDSASGPGSSFWTPTELQTAVRRRIVHALKRGWQYAEGLLVKGGVKARVTSLMPYGVPGGLGADAFNPKTDAFALRLGGEYVGPNRYRLPAGLVVDHLGACRDDRECPECGSIPGPNGGYEADYRYWVPVAKERRPPNMRPWQNVYTCCRRCVSPEEREENNRRALAAPPPRQGGTR